jgi:phage FluMu protein Com
MSEVFSMNGQGSQISCRNCSKVTLLKSAGYYQDGSQRLLCECCEQDGGVLHQCTHDHWGAPPRWLPLLLAGIAVVCPKCKEAYDLGVKIEPAYPEAGEALKFAGLFIGTLVLINVIVDSLRGKKRRR